MIIKGLYERVVGSENKEIVNGSANDNESCRCSFGIEAGVLGVRYEL